MDAARQYQELRFARTFALDPKRDKKAACINAGLPVSAGPRLLKKPHIKREIEKELSKQEKRLRVNSDSVLEELGKIGFSNVKDYLVADEDGNLSYDLEGIDEFEAAAIQSVVLREGKVSQVNLYSKKEALELLGKHYRLFVDKKEVEITATMNFQMLLHEDVIEGECE